MSNKVEHLVYFRFKDGISHAQKQNLVVLLNDLLGKIDGLEAVSAGLNTTEEHQFKHNYDVGMRMLFRNRQKLQEYQLHPEHLKVGDFIWTIAADVAVVDFELE
jgi:hypothetical protein